ncbi:MAG TPA: PA14 domain-containing protein, partial [Planctomycetaceae bacterium]|nr:PA14 domain-containing protein [Planctomycetaceae bacterium]
PHRLELEFVEGRLTAWCRLHWLRTGDESFPEQPVAPECLFHTMRQIADLDVAVLPKPAPTHSATAAPGAHPVLVDPGTLRPGLWGEYFADIGFTKFVMARTDTAINFDWRDRSPHPDMPKDNFGVRWRGYLQAPAAGKYTIVVLGDDGVRVRLDHENIIDELDTWGRVRRTADVELDNKPHELNIDFREQDNHAWCQLRWSREGKDGFEEKPIEGGFLFHTPEQAQRNTAGE